MFSQRLRPLQCRSENAFTGLTINEISKDSIVVYVYRMSKNAKPPGKKSISAHNAGYERGIVTFLDVLGFRNLLEVKSASEIAGVMQNLRRFAEGSGNKEEPPRRSDEIRLYTQAFSESVSDAVVRVRTVDTQSRDGPFVYELIDLMHAQVECINQGILIRGGMTIGPVHAGIVDKGPIFGKAMVRAYEIEEKEAIYPRIMIDEELVQAYLSDDDLWQDGQRGTYEANLVQKFIGVSEDGSYFLDYLNAADPGEFDDGVFGQFQFLDQHKKLIENGLNETSGRTRRKYIWLANYHNRKIEKLQAGYDMRDRSGAFKAEIGMSPKKLFKRLKIVDNWSNFESELKALKIENE